MAYVPDPTNVNQPIDSVFAETATAEFRALKAYIQGLAFGAAPVGNFSLKNKLIGGDFSSNPWQRATSGNGLTHQYIADRWRQFRIGSTAGMTLSKLITIDPTFLAAMRVARDPADASIQALSVANSMESRDSIPMTGKTVTLTCRGVKGANFSGSASLTLYSGTGTDQNIGDAPFTGQTQIAQIDIGNSFTASPNTFSVTGVVPINATQLGVQYIHVPSGVAGASDYIDFYQIQVEDSPVFTGFDRRPAGLELALCQRYYNTGTVYILWAPGSAVPIGQTVPLSPNMRVAPTMGAPIVSGLVNCTGGTTDSASTREFRAWVSASGVGSTSATIVWTASAEL